MYLYSSKRCGCYIAYTLGATSCRDVENAELIDGLRIDFAASTNKVQVICSLYRSETDCTTNQIKQML